MCVGLCALTCMMSVSMNLWLDPMPYYSTLLSSILSRSCCGGDPTARQCMHIVSM